MSGSMSGVWKRSQVRTSEAPPDERGGKQICSGYSYRATSRLYQLRPIEAAMAKPDLQVERGPPPPRPARSEPVAPEEAAMTPNRPFPPLSD